jgi:hypothetical protein
MRMKGAQARPSVVVGAVGKERRRERSERWTTRRSYTPRKRRWARARALPDAGVAVSACGLAVWSFTKKLFYTLLLFLYKLGYKLLIGLA